MSFVPAFFCFIADPNMIAEPPYNTEAAPMLIVASMPKTARAEAMFLTL